MSDQQEVDAVRGAVERIARSQEEPAATEGGNGEEKVVSAAPAVPLSEPATAPAWAPGVGFSQTPLVQDANKEALPENPATPPVTHSTTATPPLAQSPIRYSDQVVPQATPTVAMAIQETERAAQREKEAPGLWQGMRDAASAEWIISAATFNGPSKQVAMPDPTFRWDPEEYKAATKDLPKDLWPILADAHSKEHAEWLGTQLKEKVALEKRLEEMGWTGTGLRVAAAIIDPSALALGIATEGLAASVIIPAKAAALTRIAGRAVSAGIAGGAIVGAKDALDLERHTASDYLWGVGFGLALGGTIGAVTGRTADPLASTMLSSGARLQAVADGLPDAGSVGARRLAPKDFFLNDEALEALSDGDIPKTALNGRWRQESSGVIDRSPSPIARSLGSALLEDSVGKEGHVLSGVAAETEMRRFYQRDAAKLASAEKGIFEEYSKDMGFIEREKAWPGFIDEVGRYIRNPEAFAEVDPHVSKLANHYRQFFADRLDFQQNPLRDAGIESRPVAGTENIQKNGTYMPRVYDTRKMRDLLEAHGTERINELVAGAIRSAQPDLDEKIIQKMAKGVVRNRMKDAHGVTEDPKFAFLGRDENVLRQVLTDEYGLTGKDVDDVIAKLPTKAPTEGGGVEQYVKRRIDLDEGYEMRGIRDRFGNPVDTLRFSDLLVNDASQLANVYNRRSAGRIALARVRIKDGDGNVVVNGLTKDSEFELLLKRIKEQGGDALVQEGANPGAVDAAVKNLEWAYAAILGRPSPGITGWTGSQGFRTFSRWSRKYNFARLMGNMGFNQAHEAVNIVGQTGWRAALSMMPSLKRIRDMDGALIRKHGLDQELEGIFGLGSEELRNSRFPRWDEYGGDYRTDAAKGAMRVERVLDKMGDVTSHISGFSYVNELTQLWAARSVVQKFALMAANDTPENLRRMASIGLDEGGLKAVLKQIREHATLEDGTLFKGKVQKLNMDDWKDLDARAAFENAVFRWSRRVIQENDYGSMAHWMSDPLVQMITQFRGFVINAFAKQFLHNLHIRDFNTFTTMLYSMVMGGAVYSLQEQLKAVGRSDREAHLEKRLSPEKIAWASFARSGWASIVPDAMATVARPMGIPLPNIRSSGQASDLWFGNPTTGLFDDFNKASSGLVKVGADVRGATKEDITSAARVLPWGNYIPAAVLLNFMTDGMPERSGRRR